MTTDAERAWEKQWGPGNVAAYHKHQPSCSCSSCYGFVVARDNFLAGFAAGLEKEHDYWTGKLAAVERALAAARKALEEPAWNSPSAR